MLDDSKISIRISCVLILNELQIATAPVQLYTSMCRYYRNRRSDRSSTEPEFAGRVCQRVKIVCRRAAEGSVDDEDGKGVGSAVNRRREGSGNKSVAKGQRSSSGAPLYSHRGRNGVLSSEDFRVNFLVSVPRVAAANAR